MTRGKPIRAASYCRLSLAAMGDTTKVDDQDSLNHAVAQRLGWTIRPEHVYKQDNSKSAWRRDRKRPGWDAMLTAIEAGEIDAIVVYHGDRLIRQPYDLEKLINIADQKGILLASPTGTRNLDDPDDRYILRIEAAHACRSSDDTSRRTKRGHERRRQQGMVRAGGRGGRAFGFEKDHITHRPAEVELMREAADRVLNADDIGGICKDWTGRGITTVTGRPFEHGSLKKTLMRPRYAGLMPDGVTRAAWAPVYDDDPDKARQVWEAVCAVLAGKTVTFTPNNAHKYLLSGIAVCGTCEMTVQMRQHSRRRPFLLLGYGCVNPECSLKVQRQIVYVDDYVGGAVVELLNDKRYIAGLRGPGDPGLAREIAALEARKAEAERQLARLVDLPHVKPELLAEAIGGFDRRIEELRGKVAMSARRRLLVRHAGLDLEGWKALPLATRRALVRAAYRVTILPVRRKGPGFDPETIRLDKVKD